MLQFIAALLLAAAPTLQGGSGGQTAFDGAEGWGRYTVGGRGGRHYCVTTLADSGPGSLREAVEATGARTVTFAVNGTIELRSPLRIDNDSITILGHTSGGDGVCLKDYPLSINASEVIVRYLRIRPGDRHAHDADGLGGGRYGQHHVIVDHCSVSWSIDECLSLYKTAYLTVQWCMVTHSLNRSRHTKGAHGFGGIWGGYKATFHHNLVACHASRNPRIASVDGTRWVDVRNNVFYNWGFKTGYGGGHHAEVNIVGNYYKPGPASQRAHIFDVAADSTGRYHISGNFMEGRPDITADNRLGVGDTPGRPYLRHRRSAVPGSGILPGATPLGGEERASCLADSPFPYAAIAEDTPARAYERVLEQAGCSHRRDSYDASVTAGVRAGTAPWGTDGIIDTPAQAGGWPVLR